MLSFRNVGSGSEGNATIFYDEETTILLDVGLSKRRICKELSEIGRDFSDISALFITHNHSDHTGNIDIFPKDKPIYGGIEVNPNINVPLYSLDVVTVGTIDVTAFGLSHDAKNTMGYLFESGGTKIVYLTDTGYLPSRILPILKDADYLIFESNHDIEMLLSSSRPPSLKKRIAGKKGHLSNLQAAEYLSYLISPNTKVVYLAHLSRECNTPEKAMETMKEHFGELPCEFVCLNQKNPTKGGD